MPKSKRAAISGASPPKAGPRPPPARALLLTIGRESFPSRRGFWRCYADRKGPRSRASRKSRAGSRTRCAGFLPAWCARSSGSALRQRRPTTAVSTGSLAPDPSPLRPPLSSRARDHAAALARAGRDRGRDRSHPFAPARRVAAAMAAGVRTNAPLRSEQGSAGSDHCSAAAGASVWRP